MAFDLGAVLAHIKLDATDFKNGINEVQNNLKNIGSGIKDFANQATVFTGVATAGIVAFGKSSFDAYNEAQAASAQLRHAVLDVTHATEEQLSATEDLADELERKGVLDGDNIKTGLAQLSTFGLSNKAVRGLGQSLADLAVNQFGVNASGEQLSQTANMIAKALNGQFGVLEKSGIRFSEAQRKAIEFGTEMEKVKAINEGFAQNLKYTNDVALTTMEGKLAHLNVQWGNFKERIGAIISGFAEFIATGNLTGDFLRSLGIQEDDERLQGLFTLREILQSIAQWISENQALVISFFEGLGIAIAALMVIGTVNALLVALLNPLTLVAIAITALFMAWQTNFLGIRDITQGFVDFLTGVFNDIILPMLDQFNAWLTDTFYPAFNNVWNNLIVPMFNAFVGWFKERWDYITLILQGAWDIISGIVKLGWAIVSGILTIGLKLLAGDWSGAWEALKKATSSSWDAIKQIFSGAIEFVKGWGGTIFHEIVKPFEDAWGKVQELVNKVKEKMKDLNPLERHSPSVVDLVRKGVDSLIDEYSRLGDMSMPTAHQIVPAGVGAGGGLTGITINMAGANITSPQVADSYAEMIGDKIISKLKQQVRF